MPTYEYQCDDCGVIEIFHGMTEEDKAVCPECDGGLKKLISLVGAVIIAGRCANQYNDIKRARFWRDKNGVRHPVTTADGHVNSATVSKQTATPQEMKAIKKKDIKQGTKDRLKAQKMRADNWNKKQLEK